MLEAAAYLYIGAGTMVALVNAEAAKKGGLKSQYPTVTAVVHTAVCLLFWPIIAGYVCQYLFRGKAR